MSTYELARTTTDESWMLYTFVFVSSVARMWTLLFFFCVLAYTYLACSTFAAHIAHTPSSLFRRENNAVTIVMMMIMMIHIIRKGYYTNALLHEETWKADIGCANTYVVYSFLFLICSCLSIPVPQFWYLICLQYFFITMRVFNRQTILRNNIRLSHDSLYLSLLINFSAGKSKHDFVHGFQFSWEWPHDQDKIFHQPL